jgi:hypothetical protein
MGAIPPRMPPPPPGWALKWIDFVLVQDEEERALKRGRLSLCDPLDNGALTLAVSDETGGLSALGPLERALAVCAEGA